MTQDATALLPVPDPAANKAQISFTVPAWVVSGREMTAEMFASWVRVSAALYRYGRSEITLSTAAALAGVTQREFLRLLKQAGQNSAEIDWDDLDQELARSGVTPATSTDDAG